MTTHKVKAVAPRLSDEDLDPIEQDEQESIASSLINEGWLPWDAEDIKDIKRLIAEKMPQKQRFVLEAFLQGLSYNDIGVSEKHWRYHFNNGLEFIKQELKV
jgi:DNA-directed RNA polymerase specialized sigma24 family protein